MEWPRFAGKLELRRQPVSPQELKQPKIELDLGTGRIDLKNPENLGLESCGSSKWDEGLVRQDPSEGGVRI